ncbi:MAG: DUF2085 domain-containing protein [Anaerolineae bacterium]|nr:DUF2085 domain-containing protein [Anaerolineae bacterium]
MTRIDVRTPDKGWAAAVNTAVNRLAGWLARHWLATFNAFVVLFVGLPFLAPVLVHAGLERPAQLIYTIYAPTCHQLPERSFFLFGRQMVYHVHELEELGALPAGTNLLQRIALRFNGQAETGYKVAICQRDIAIYGAVFLNGLLFAAVRSRLRRKDGKMPKLPLWLFGILLIPLVVDGASQLVGLRESTWWLRLVTGGLFGSALVWLAYPYVQDAMAEVQPASRPDAAASEGRQILQKPPSAV